MITTHISVHYSNGVRDNAEHVDIAAALRYINAFAKARGYATLAVVDANGSDIRKGNEVCTRQIVDLCAAHAPVIGTAVVTREAIEADSAARAGNKSSEAHRVAPVRHPFL